MTLNHIYQFTSPGMVNEIRKNCPTASIIPIQQINTRSLEKETSYYIMWHNIKELNWYIDRAGLREE